MLGIWNWSLLRLRCLGTESSQEPSWWALRVQLLPHKSFKENLNSKDLGYFHAWSFLEKRKSQGYIIKKNSFAHGHEYLLLLRGLPTCFLILLFTLGVTDLWTVFICARLWGWENEKKSWSPNNVECSVLLRGLLCDAFTTTGEHWTSGLLGLLKFAHIIWIRRM